MPSWLITTYSRGSRGRTWPKPSTESATVSDALAAAWAAKIAIAASVGQRRVRGAVLMCVMAFRVAAGGKRQ
ncbi:hypothetical protein B1R27_26875 [Streptomyces sp. GKU 895]|nr:hypothetical protein B1R27_26875 [Streptomyces sp. GKU 895]